MFVLSSTLTPGIILILLGAIFLLVTFTRINNRINTLQPLSPPARKVTGVLGIGLLVLGLSVSLLQTLPDLKLYASSSHATTTQVISRPSPSTTSFTATPTQATPSPTAVTDPQRVAVPSYFSPDAGALWTQIEKSAPTAGLAIINPNSGPGTSKDSGYADQVTSTESKNVLVIGYVSTGYAGTQDRSRTLAAVKQDVDNYYRWYPNIDGIFVDEVSTDCNSQSSYYQPLYSYIKSKGGIAKVVLDPGTNVPKCYISAGDIIVNFDDTYANYLNWSPESWVTSYPASRFWQIIHSTSKTNMAQAIALSQSRNAGWVYATDAGGDNPFGTLPTYWSDELSLVNHPQASGNGGA